MYHVVKHTKALPKNYTRRMINLIFLYQSLSSKEKKTKVGQTESCKHQSSVNTGNHPRNAALAKEIGCLENTNIMLNKSTEQV